MKKFLIDIRGMLSSDGSSKISSKRFVTFSAFLMVTIAFLSNLFFDFKVNESIFDGMTQIVWAGLGVTVGEHILKNRGKEGDTTNNVTLIKSEPIDEVCEEDDKILGDN